MRRPYIHPFGGQWPFGSVPVPKLLRDMDQYSSELVNIVDGGTWAPADPIVLGQGGATGTLILGGGSNIAGDVETVKGNGAHTEYGLTGLVCLGSSLPFPYPAFQTPRDRSFVQTFERYVEGNYSVFTGGTGRDTYSGWKYDSALRGLVSVPPTLLETTTAGRQGSIVTIVLDRRATHQSSTLASVQLRYRIRNRPSVVPTTKPQMRLIRVVSSGGAVYPLHTTAGAYAANGWLPVPDTDVESYWASGNVKTLTYVPNQYNVGGDGGLNSNVLLLQFFDDSTNYNVSAEVSEGNQFLSATFNLTSIGDFRPE